MFKKIFDFLNNPRTALLIMVIFLLAYFLSEGFTSGFGNNFLSFGPTTDNTGAPTMFMGIKLNTWSNVITVYFLIFITTILRSYYYNVIGTNVHTHIYNPIPDFVIPYAKFWTYLVLMIDPFIGIVLYVINFYAIATLQIQYIIPSFIASYIVDLPFTLKWLSGRKFIS